MSDDDPLATLLQRDRRYVRAAYEFVRDALQHTLAEAGEQRHVTARELLDGIRDLARASFGPLARTVVEDWGVRSTADFGHIVFNLIEVGMFGKTDDDRLTDFAEVYTFDEAFPPEMGDVRVQSTSDDDLWDDDDDGDDDDDDE